MNSSWRHVIRFIVLVLLQVLVFQRMSMQWGGFTYMHFIIYPLFILLLPIKTPRILVLLLSFLIGIVVDGFYNSPGVHASAAVLIGYLRSFILNLLEPYEGYNIDDSPNLATMGIGWFMSYVSVSMLIFLFTYFSVEAFSFVYIFDIILDTIFSLIVSFIMIIVSQYVFGVRR